MTTKIQWCDETVNPMPGCSHVSPACDHCYAERMASTRLAHLPQYKGLTTGGRWNGSTRFIPGELNKPFRWKKPRRVFVNSMGDLFHDRNSFDDVDAIFAMMADCPQHTFMVLTKRPARMQEYMSPSWRRESVYGLTSTAHEIGGPGPWPLPNVWLGVTAEDQARAEERIPLLLETPAAVRFVSVEPMLERMNLERWLTSCEDCGNSGSGPLFAGRPGLDLCGMVCTKKGEGPSLDWCICGGESGPGARPSHPDWFRSLRDQCAAEAGVPFFFKSWGDWAPRHDLQCRELAGKLWTNFDPDTSVCRVGKQAAGRLIDGREHNEFPQTGRAGEE